MKTKKVLFTIIGLFAISVSVFANNNSAGIAAPAPAAKLFLTAEVLDVVIAKADQAPVAENTVLAQNKAEALSMSGLKPAMLSPELLSNDVVKQLEQFQAETKALEAQIKLDKQITEVK